MITGLNRRTFVTMPTIDQRSSCVQSEHVQGEPDREVPLGCAWALLSDLAHRYDHVHQHSDRLATGTRRGQCRSAETGNVSDPFCSNVQHAFRWDEQNGPVDPGTLGGGMSAVGSRAATPRRQEVGVTQPATGENRGFLSSPGQPMVALGPLEVGGQSEASAINIDGVVVGMVPSADGTTSQAVTWTPLPAPGGMQITDLGALLCRHLKRGRCCARRRRRLGCAGIP